MIKTDKLLRLKNPQGRPIRVVREHYLRSDIPCQSPLCTSKCSDLPGNKYGNSLPYKTSHYIVPDCSVAKAYLELFEFPQVEGVIFMQTVVNFIQHDCGKKLYKRLEGLIKDSEKHSVVFYNEFHRDCWSPREPGESVTVWQMRNIYAGAKFYHSHLNAEIPIIILCDDESMIKQYRSLIDGVHVSSLKDYMNLFWSDITGLAEVYESLTSSLEDKSSNDTSYAAHLSSSLIEAGLASGNFIQGVLQVNKHNAQTEAFIKKSEVGSKDSEQTDDILIWGVTARNRAVQGDRVVVELLPKSEWRGRSLAIHENEEDREKDKTEQLMPTGKVVGILERNWKEYVASFSENEESRRTNRAGKVIVVPFDYRIPKIRISTRQVDMLRDHRILVKIDSWPKDSHYPNGHLVRSLGKSGDLETEIQSILIENNIDVAPFSDVQLKELPSNTSDNQWSASCEEINKRKDLRDSHLVFSIDPKGCEDVDDTLSIRKISKYRTELGVHIADVSHFVRPDMLTDKEASSRSTTVYLADRRYDMLPAVLSSDLCSLISGVDRYAVSVLWEVDSNFEVRNVWYGRTIIRSSYKLFYEIAQSIYDNSVTKQEIIENIPELQSVPEDKVNEKIKELTRSIKSLIEIAHQFKSKREAGGALELEGVEVRVQMDKDKKIEDLLPRQTLKIHETIAECMILANHWVAKKIYEIYPLQSLLRHHPLPKQEHFQKLINCAEARGFNISTKSNKTLAESLDSCVDPDDETVNKLLRMLATQAMSNASYFSTGSLEHSEFFHYGLALDYYTHFTSPIRRYADVIVHRLLLAAIDEDRGCSVNLLNNKDLSVLAEHINQKHRAAQFAQKSSLELFQTLYFEQITAEDDPRSLADAVVYELRTNGLLVYVPRYGIKGAVYLRDREDRVVFINDVGGVDWTRGILITDDKHSITVETQNGSQQYRLFDHISVRIKVLSSHSHSSKIRLELVARQSHHKEAESQPSDQKSMIIQSVKESAAEENSEDNLSLGPHFKDWKKEFGQTSASKSLYNLILKFRDSSMLTNKP